MRRDFPASASRDADSADLPQVTTRLAADRPADPSSPHRLRPDAAVAEKAGPDPTLDPMLAFASETEELVVRPPGPISTHAPPRVAKDPVVPQPRRLEVTLTSIGFTVLALVVLAQGALIAIWLNSGRVTSSDNGSVTVTSEPAGAPVSVDGAARGVTPFTVALASGSHRIDVGVGDHIRTQTVTVARGGDASVHVELRPEPAPTAATAGALGGLQISTDPSGARVWVDGEARGAAPISVANLKPGPHDVTVRTASVTVNRRVTVQEGVVAALIISMNAGGSEFATGWLAIASPVSAQILENGTLLGTTDTPRILVPAGRHDLELTNASLGYRAQRTVQITAGQTTSIRLEVPRGTLHVNALPWAEVWINGQRVGETPIGNLSLPIGSHELLFRHPELGEQKKTVIVSAGAPVRVGVDLRK